MNWMPLPGCLEIRLFMQNNIEFNYMKKAFYSLLTINIIIAAFFAVKKIKSAYGNTGNPPVSYYDQWNTMRRSVYSIMPIDSSDIVFIGDSHTECFPVTEIFGEHVKNRGIGGNQTEHILNRLSEIISYRPRKIFIEVGVNDMVIGNNRQIAIDNYKKIIATIKTVTPATILYVQSIFPVTQTYSIHNQDIVTLNKQLAQYCKEQGVQFIDIYPRMVSDGRLDSTMTIDGLHLNGKGYKVWEEAIKGYVN